MFVPIVNVIMFLVFAYKEWPIQRELAELRGWANQIQRGGQVGAGTAELRPAGLSPRPPPRP